jgi:hypothetical protein
MIPIRTRGTTMQAANDLTVILLHVLLIDINTRIDFLVTESVACAIFRLEHTFTNLL